jgi:uncharacterized SAM-binding protein YcdF (DUF218 family)
MSRGAPEQGRAARPSPVPRRLHFTRERSWGRWLRLAAAVLVLAALAAIGVALPVVVLPETRPVPGETDAVVLLAGGGGERAAAAERVMPRGGSELLVVSDGRRADGPGGSPRLPCGRTAPEGYRILCVEPVPATTRGEARAVANLAAERGWESVTLLTSTYHVSRARLLFERCVEADIEVVGATPDLGPAGWARISAEELVALARDRVLQRGC